MLARRIQIVDAKRMSSKKRMARTKERNASQAQSERKKPEKNEPVGKPPAPEDKEQRLFITKKYIESMPIKHWDGDTRVLNTIDEMKTAVDEIMASNEECLGFDIESRPTFVRKTFNPPALLQIATETTVYLFRLCHLHGDRETNSKEPHNAETFAFLLPLLTTPSILKAGVGIREDMKNLQSLLHFQAEGVCSLETLVQHTIQNPSLNALAAHFLKIRAKKAKKTTMSNWAKEEPLREKQIEYAATDAWLGRAIWKAMCDEGYDMVTTVEPCTKRPKKKRKTPTEKTTGSKQAPKRRRTKSVSQSSKM